MAELYIVRHGQASFGADDYDRLSSLGERQAFLLGQYFAERDIGFERILTGTLRRHRQTVQAIFEGAGAAGPVAEQAGLNEYDFEALGAAASRLRPELGACFRSRDKTAFYRGMREALLLWSQGRLDGAVPETWGAFQARIRGVLADVRQNGARRTLIVSSGGAMGLAAQDVLGGPDRLAIDLNMQLFNTGVCRYFYNPDRIRLSSFNALPHLDRKGRAELITYA